MTPKIP